jgi:hypothetical protein
MALGTTSGGEQGSPLGPAAVTKQKAIDDILGLFGPNGGATAQPAATPAAATSLASVFGQTVAPAPAAVVAAQPPALQQAQGTWHTRRTD